MDIKAILRVHAVRRMFERGVSLDDVHAVLANCETIESYASDTPYPSRLVLGWIGARPLHAVVAYNEIEDETILVTVYQPDPAAWETDFRRRK